MPTTCRVRLSWAVHTHHGSAFFADETPHLIDFDAYLAGFFFKRSGLPRRLGVQGVDEALEPGAGHADDTNDGAQAQALQEQPADEAAFLFGDRAFAWVGDEAVAAGTAAEGGRADGVDAVADDMGGGTTRAGRDRDRFGSCSVHIVSIPECRAKSHYPWRT
jgi:hypothetical protein